MDWSFFSLGSSDPGFSPDELRMAFGTEQHFGSAVPVATAEKPMFVSKYDTETGWGELQVITASNIFFLLIIFLFQLSTFLQRRKLLTIPL